MSIENAFKEVGKIYDLMPATTCMETSCANWCCTKMLSKVDEADGVFMPLPLIYGIEYLFIIKHLKEKYPDHSLEQIFDFSKKTKLCPFKDKVSRNCMLYPVRPFSCRVYGRKVPPVFWGMQVPPEQAEAIYCKNMKVDDKEKQLTFIEEYPKIWTKLAELSYQYSPFSEWQKQMLQKIIGVPNILVLAFGEYYFLTTKSPEWYENNFSTYWEMMGNRL